MWANRKQNNFNIYNAAYFLKHKEKHLKISLFYTCAPKISIWSSFWKKWKKIPGDIILLHVYQKLYDLWFLKYKARQNVLLFWAIFVLSPTWRPIKPKFWKIKKIPGGIIILLMCTINDNHMMYGSWDMEGDRIFYFEPFFALLPPYGPRKSKFWNKKNTYRYYRFTQLYHNDNHIMYGSCDMEQDGHNFL